MDNPENLTTDNVDVEPIEEPDLQDDINVTPEDQEEMEKQGLLTGLMSKIFGAPEPEPEDGDDDLSGDSTGSDLEGEEVPAAFTQAAEAAGWTAEMIEDFASDYDDAQLIDMIPYLKGEENKQVPETPVQPKQESVTPKSQDFNNEQLGPLVEQITKAIDAKYQEKFAKTEERLRAYEEERVARESARQAELTDNFFDKASKDFPVFGDTKELPRFPKGSPNAGQIIPAGEAFDARNAVWKTAMAFQLMGGRSWEESLNEALDWYKGKNMEKEVHRKVVKEFKSNEKRLSPKRSDHHVEKIYASESEEKAAVVMEAAKAAGYNVG